MTLTCAASYADETTGNTIHCQWRHGPDGMHHAHDGTRCIVWTEGAAGINTASDCPQPPAIEFTEYGYLAEYPDGTRSFMSFLGDRNDRDYAFGQYQAIAASPASPEGERLVFVSRRVTQTPWTEEA